MLASPTTRQHSAKVRLDLYIDGQLIPLAQIGGGELVFDQAIVLSGTTGEVRATIDDFERRWNVTWEPSNLPRQIIPAEYRDLV